MESGIKGLSKIKIVVGNVRPDEKYAEIPLPNIIYTRAIISLWSNQIVEEGIITVVINRGNREYENDTKSRKKSVDDDDSTSVHHLCSVVAFFFSLAVLASTATSLPWLWTHTHQAQAA